MSIWNTLYTGASGIRAFGDGLQVVGDNIANVSTIGFKGARAQFEAMLGGSASNGQRLGNGVRMAGPQVLFGGGAIVQSQDSLNMALDGDGFFAVRDPKTGLTSYTRNGQFGLDQDGFLVGDNGRVQAFAVDGAGAMAPGTDDLRVPSVVSGSMTTRVDLNVQLDYDAVPPTSAFDPDDSTTYNYATQVTLTDSVGGRHQATVYFFNTAPGQWQWTAMVDGAEVGQTPGQQTEIGSGSLGFDALGRLDAQQGGIDVSFGSTVQNQLIALDFGEPLSDGGDGSGSSSLDHAHELLRMGDDGVAASALADVRVTEDGSIIARYTNGQERVVAAVAVAKFDVDSGLERGNNQSFVATFRSGEPILGMAESGGRGTIYGGALESSNVDLSEELVTLIAYQRAFQSNARTITTADEVLQEVANLKR